MNNVNEKKLTAAEEVLIAAINISENGKKEFTEWELTVQTWKMNKQRWGLRGFEENYPDHKRVMNEVMAKGTNKVIGKGWIERIKTNYYQVTDLGLSRIKSNSSAQDTKKSKSLYEYDAIAEYALHPVFKKYCDDNTEPKTWLGVAAFLGLSKNDPDILENRIMRIRVGIEKAIEWMRKNNLNYIRRDDTNKPPISFEKVLKLKEFLTDIQSRFAAQFDAIRKKKK